MEIDYIMLNMIMELFSSKESFEKFDDLKNDEDKEKKIVVELMIPVKFQVCIKRLSIGKYELSFANDNGEKSEVIRNQIENLIIPTLKKYIVLITTYNNADPAEKSILQEKIKGIKGVKLFVIQDESALDNDLATTHLIFLSHDTSDELKKQLKDISMDYFKDIRLVKCSRCHCFFCPNQENEQCITGKHKGKQIPFETGEMEQVDVDEDGEPYYVINMSCCGEVIKDDTDIDSYCDKVIHGKHIEDKVSDLHSDMVFSESLTTILSDDSKAPEASKDDKSEKPSDSPSPPAPAPATTKV